MSCRLLQLFGDVYFTTFTVLYKFTFSKGVWVFKGKQHSRTKLVKARVYMHNILSSLLFTLVPELIIILKYEMCKHTIDL